MMSLEPFKVLKATHGFPMPVDFDLKTGLVVLSSLAFLAPSVSSWQMARFWHSWMFVVLTLLCGCFHLCAGEGLDRQGLCNPVAVQWVPHAFHFWVSICFLQMAFIVLGLEDPQLQALGVPPALRKADAATSRPVPVDVIILSRVVPIILLGLVRVVSVISHGSRINWLNLLVTELLLFFCSGAFWMRRGPPEILLRLKYWHHVLHQGCIPAMMLFWFFCIMELSNCKAMQAMWHFLLAACTVGILRSARNNDRISPQGGALDLTLQNSNVAPLILGSPMFIILPILVASMCFDWCSTGESSWPTMARALACQPGGYVIAIMSVPAFAAAALAFWLIDQTSTHKPSLQWEAQDGPVNQRQRLLAKHLGCQLGYAGSAAGLLAVVVTRNTLVQELASRLFGLVSIIAFATAMSLTVLSSESPSRSSQWRSRFTFFVCVPLLVLNIILALVSRCTACSRAWCSTPWVYAVSEYAALLVLTSWPLIWIPMVRNEILYKSGGVFSWPVTAWRFD